LWKSHLYTNNMSDNYAEETKPLFKLLKTEAFRFVIVRYNHYSLVSQLEQDLKRLFPNRPFAKADAQKLTYQDISKQYFDLKQGFFFLENFDMLLNEERNSLNKETPPMKIENERRRHITAGLNLRRDKLAQFPIALFVFIPTTSDPFFAKTIMEKMPDLWSFRSFMVDLEKEIVVKSSNVSIGNFNNYSGQVNFEDVIKSNPKEEKELNRLLALLEKTPENELAYRLTLYPQIVNNAIEAGEYNVALLNLNEWENNAVEHKGYIWLRKGDIYKNIGESEQAVSYFKKAALFFEDNGDEINLSMCFDRLGTINLLLGDVEAAVNYHTKFNSIQKKLYSGQTDNYIFKNNLAISFERLGDTYYLRGDLNNASLLYENSNTLQKELNMSYSNNSLFKNNLAFSYLKLGSIYSELKNFNYALAFYNDYHKLATELYALAPQNINFKDNLAVSYLRLGITYFALGDLQKALTFYEQYNDLEKSLCIDYPENVFFKNSLAISYSKIGEVYLKLDYVELALSNYNACKNICEELVKRSSMNVDFQAHYAESIAASAATNILISKSVHNQELLKAQQIFYSLHSDTNIPYFEKKAAIIDKMLEPDSDLKALILEMSMF
jgi:tetratricopeptide (TPR) repeat protein